MKRRLHILIPALCAFLTGMSQHTPITSQYLFNGLLINPAYAGSRDALTANLTHRHQWAGFDGAPVTQVLSVHAPVKTRKVGLGLMVVNDRIGVSRETGVMSNYAYRMRLGKGRLALGLGAGFITSRSNWQDVALQQSADATFQPMARASMKPNFSTGAFYYTSRSFVGLSLPFLVRRQWMHNAEINGTRLVNMQPMLFGGHIIPLNDALKLKPSMLARYATGSGLQGDLSANLIIQDKVWLGTSYRSNDAMVWMLEALPTPQWRLGYAYDMSITPLRRYHGGTHELMVQYELGYRIRVKDPRYF